MQARLRRATRLPGRLLRHLRPPREDDPADNFEANRRLWERFARGWAPERASLDVPVPWGKERDSYVASTVVHLGDEWGRPSDVDEIVEAFVYPFVGERSVAAELGVGGGRIALKVVDRVRRLYALDISAAMLERARGALGPRANVEYVLLEEPRLPAELTERVDFLYSFDVFVHFDLHMMRRMLGEIARVLVPAGKAFVHTTNLAAPGGWERFAGQDSYSVKGHFFVSPETVRILAERAGFRVVKSSSPDPANFYLNRDYLVVLEKRT